MARSASASRRPSEFEDFLFAPIGAERNGMLLSVLSALARLDLDPWREAADLARMSKKMATERMTLLISTLPDRTSAQANPEAIAARLVALLPQQDKSYALPRGPLLRVEAATNARFIIFIILMAFLLSTQFFKTSRQPALPADAARMPTSNAESPPGSGQ